MINHYAKVEYKGMKTIGVTDYTNQTPHRISDGTNSKSNNRNLEDLKVLKRSPDLLNHVKIGKGQLRLIIETYFVFQYIGVAAILVI